MFFLVALVRGGKIGLFLGGRFIEKDRWFRGGNGGAVCVDCVAVLGLDLEGRFRGGNGGGIFFILSSKRRTDSSAYLFLFRVFLIGQVPSLLHEKLQQISYPAYTIHKEKQFNHAVSGKPLVGSQYIGRYISR